ncbi:TetR/AcrR family transcriptional regulator [Pseudomonas gingeri]|uniref:TetR/AcrR family transcriptional regulator n=1 Tax=Pseudomonas gingeri TaxID=117681 RepID=UPI0015A17A49|nr:TetR/AcrR family transcriptional regulator [Pseudomonas gingeri]NVZ99064.1 TetR/AcrR family transcriptional regulator [Pseudomonas gingeri]NWA13109.1 TetR/AcrR family transcriptional regulator [Pseudomonas gingeri]NWA55370.1 TetR/AcrR family transcriptional regulator [Pseudomonas gingeri]NWA95776.1 TetR/AcrR family transcriptional regulator [Pseudomonas gingeri]NWB00864.1 TetR/AcrR family transcriptional regulator [Pseudomonas gingeri]
MTTDTRQTILQAAQTVVQARGYNALSFRELAKDVGIKSASIHYHFPTKGDLGAALARRYTEGAVVLFEQFLTASREPSSMLKEYTAVFRAALENGNRMCLCGILAAEHHDLPPEVQVEVKAFTDANIAWLTRVLALEQADAQPEALRQQAFSIFAAIQGAQLVSRGRNDIAIYDQLIGSYRLAGLIP